jgi:hypothetical protein
MAAFDSPIGEAFLRIGTADIRRVSHCGHAHVAQCSVHIEDGQNPTQTSSGKAIMLLQYSVCYTKNCSTGYPGSG